MSKDIKIAEWAKENFNGNWSNNWVTENKHRIACPNCGCTTVSPISISEALNNIYHTSQDFDPEDQFGHRASCLIDSTGIKPHNPPNELKDIFEHDHTIDSQDLNKIENFHRKHGAFVCGNYNCDDLLGLFFSPHEHIMNDMPNNEIWNDKKKQELGYNNAWDIGSDKIDMNHDIKKKDFW